MLRIGAYIPWFLCITICDRRVKIVDSKVIDEHRATTSHNSKTHFYSSYNKYFKTTKRLLKREILKFMNLLELVCESK